MRFISKKVRSFLTVMAMVAAMLAGFAAPASAGSCSVQVRYTSTRNLYTFRGEGAGSGNYKIKIYWGLGTTSNYRVYVNPWSGPKHSLHWVTGWTWYNGSWKKCAGSVGDPVVTR